MFEEQVMIDEIPPPLQFGCLESLNNNNNNKAFLGAIASPPPDLVTSSCLGAAHQLLSLNRSTANNSWAWGQVTAEDCVMMMRVGNKRGGDVHSHVGLGIAAMKMKMKKTKVRRKVREPRFCFKTMSDVDVLDDGYKWRKYGQKVVKNTQHPRSYYHCTEEKCRVKKRVERLAEDPRMVITTYEGRHVHSPSNDLQASETTSQLTDFLW
ncbi:hypothetical protein HN51_032154 [Arachis hypogaea]|uniref:probable WRKY transcription factor 13 n=1 Tax=Arachis hypogaea TaxID=3818 RepID=UPI000DEC34B8|nr:probable WRKY transcription factor 13 [Arachis hypogaea]QHO16442.1 putative WRKY transcription factor [Arachis hypogaea]